MSLFSDPQMFFSQIAEYVKLGPLAKFERHLGAQLNIFRIATFRRAKNLATTLVFTLFEYLATIGALGDFRIEILHLPQ